MPSKPGPTLEASPGDLGHRAWDLGAACSTTRPVQGALPGVKPMQMAFNGRPYRSSYITCAVDVRGWWAYTSTSASLQGGPGRAPRLGAKRKRQPPWQSPIDTTGFLFNPWRAPLDLLDQPIQDPQAILQPADHAQRGRARPAGRRHVSDHDSSVQRPGPARPASGSTSTAPAPAATAHSASRSLYYSTPGRGKRPATPRKQRLPSRPAPYGRQPGTATSFAGMH